MGKNEVENLTFKIMKKRKEILVKSKPSILILCAIMSMLIYIIYLKTLIGVSRVDVYLLFDTIGIAIAIIINIAFIKRNNSILIILIANILNIIVNVVLMLGNEAKHVIGVILLCNYINVTTTAMFYIIKQRLNSRKYLLIRK